MPQGLCLKAYASRVTASESWRKRRLACIACAYASSAFVATAYGARASMPQGARPQEAVPHARWLKRLCALTSCSSLLCSDNARLSRRVWVFGVCAFGCALINVRRAWGGGLGSFCAEQRSTEE